MPLDSKLIPNFLEYSDLNTVINDTLAPTRDLMLDISGHASDAIDATQLYFGKGYELDTIAPFVSPMVDGTPTGGASVKVESFGIPYVKHLDTLEIHRLEGIHQLQLLDRDEKGNPIRRVERAYFEKDMKYTQELLNYAIALKAQDQMRSFGLRKDVMTIQLLLNGWIDCRPGGVEFIEGQAARIDNGSRGNYARLDFARDASLKVAVNAADYFDAVIPSDPFNVLTNLFARFDPFGFKIKKMIMSPIMARKLKNNATWRQLVKDNLAALTSLNNIKPIFVNNANSLDSFRLEGLEGDSIEVIVWQKHVNAGYIKDVAGLPTGYDTAKQLSLMPDDMVIFIGADSDGNIPLYHGYGRILNLEAQIAGVGPSPMYSSIYKERKAWLIESESAPIVYGNPNCCFAVKLAI